MIPLIHSHTEVWNYVVMPNHIHLVLSIVVGAKKELLLIPLLLSVRSDVAVGDETVHDGVDAEAGDALDAEFGSDVFAVGEDGVDTD